MMIREIIIETSDDDNERQYKNPIRYEPRRGEEIFDLADEVLHELIDLHIKQNKMPMPDINITKAKYGGQAKKVRRESYIKAKNAVNKKYGKIAEVSIENLITIEANLYEPALHQMKQGKNFTSALPLIYKVNDDLLIADGNHRIVNELNMGKTTTKIFVIDIGQLAQQLQIEL